ncbi:response regulator [Cognatishimia activa]|uniref:C4-dicarboxylate transport transcriptional regulatory protein DctD n=1 Tax=Cognatishimia activa TaxID=1715691 RepID=A0A0P1IQB3_9RHOB|nr:response regulator [Cognatishimia activa]CUJ11573.1 C4-dicarboxylate transport transcriptional regulatory protein DctD [Cognatishimia activa]CUK25779.1 C4-dicarboxylate transport transcriptional regulatory protein DctD [Cognatishimia activa]
MFKKVLIIEDDAMLRSSIVQTLELEDLEPIPTNGFTQARRSIRHNFRGVILSDIKMPDHDGFDVLRFAQTKDEELPVILLTGHSDVPTAKRAIKEGAYDYLEKPCAPDTMIEALHRALKQRTLIMENREVRDELEQTNSDQTEGTLSERLEMHERRIIEEALSDADGKVAIAAEALGIPRNTLYDRMGKFNIVAKAFRKPTGN